MNKLWILLLFLVSGCGVYRFTDVTIDSSLKTFKIVYIENKARYINPQLSPKITEKLRQKLINQTKLGNTNGDADIEISGYISDYNVSTAGVAAGSTASMNRLTVGLVINIKYAKTPEKNLEENISRSFDFVASKLLSTAESELNETMVKNVVDEIFNKLFSKW